MKLKIRSNTYEVNERFISMLKEWNGYLLVISGPSGVGKTTISEELGFPVLQSITTRERRKTKESYIFWNTSAFARVKRNQEFATTVQFKEHHYGVLLREFEKKAKQSNVLVMVCSPVVYKLLKERYKKAIGIFLFASEKIVRNRLLKRDGFLDEIRIASYTNNLRSLPFYHLKINNNKFTSWIVAEIKTKFRFIQWLDTKKPTMTIRNKIYKTQQVTFQENKPKNRKKRVQPFPTVQETTANYLQQLENQHDVYQKKYNSFLLFKDEPISFETFSKFLFLVEHTRLFSYERIKNPEQRTLYHYKFAVLDIHVYSSNKKEAKMCFLAEVIQETAIAEIQEEKLLFVQQFVDNRTEKKEVIRQ